MRRLIIAASIFGIGLACTTPTEASTIVPGDGLWYSFGFGGPGSFATSGGLVENADQVSAPATPWTFSGQELLTVTDAYLSGDTFLVFDNSIPLFGGFTSAPGSSNGTYTCGSDPAVCVTDPVMSSGQFFLADGSHSITIEAINSPSGGGSADFRVDPVPEPASMFLFGTGALGLVARLRRRRQLQP